MVGVTADGETFFIGQARLLDVDVHSANGTDDANRVVEPPAGVSVGHEAIARLQLGGDGANALDIYFRIAADLELEPAVAFGPVTGHTAGHRRGVLLRDRPVEAEIGAVAAAEQHTHRLHSDLAENIPTGHVNSR